MLGKAFPYPADAGFGALPVVLAGRSRGMEPAGPMGRAAAHSCSVQGVATPAQVTALRVLWGHLRGFSLIVAYAVSIEPGSYRG